METVPCPICASTVFTPFMEVPDRFDTTGDTRWKLVRSCRCGLIMLNPRPEASEMESFYPSGGYDPHLAGSRKKKAGERFYLAARRLLLGYRAGIVLQQTKKPLYELSVLEVGCSTGDLLGFLNRKKGLPLNRLAGIETNIAAAQQARDSFGLEIQASIPAETWKDRKFDRIVLWHALEHIHAVDRLLEELRDMLENDGMMVIALPNPSCPDAEHYRQNWVAWDAPRHLYHFTPVTLEMLLEKHRLRTFGSMPYFPDTLYNLFHSEKLACRREKKPYNAAGTVLMALKAVAGLHEKSAGPAVASGMVYFVRKG
jgi:SAM-dependent methyltransferase